MQAMLDHDEARRPGNGHRRELPVLFHLMDVSRPRPPAAHSAVTAEPMQSAAADVPLTDREIASRSPEIAVSEIVGSASTHASLSITNAPAPSAPITAVPTPEPSATIEPIPERTSQPSAAAISATIAPDVPADAPEKQADLSPTASSADATATEAAAPITPEPVVRPKAQIAAHTERSSRRKSKRPASEDWFASHGKFIAVAFVLALLGTVYFARTSRQQPSAIAEKNVANAEPARRPNDKAYDSRPTDRTSGYRVTSNTTSESNTAHVESAAPSGDSKAELHPPTVPQLASDGSTSEKRPSADNLFVFPSKKGDERMAVRPEPPASSGTSTFGQAIPARPTGNSGSPAGPSAVSPHRPEMTPAYPTTSQPAPPQAQVPSPSAYPVTPAPPLSASSAMLPTPSNIANQSAGPAVAGYPPMNYGSQYAAPTGASPPPAQGWSPSLPGPGIPSQYQPSNNTARGPRYERTGSGNY